ncbi:MAG: hypothetical protein IJC04_00640 [Oscillospiraceae bacterium]|nr:hypothetical protein [Oscillospiraceae bacterium]
MKKRLYVCLIMLTVVSFLFTMTVSAVEPRYSYTNYASSSLSISDNEATCISSVSAKSTATKITATQYLEKKNGTTWSTVSGGTWSDSANGISLNMFNSKSNLSSGTYRLRTVIKVYSGTNYESFEKISSEVTN